MEAKWLLALNFHVIFIYQFNISKVLAENSQTFNYKFFQAFYFKSEIESNSIAIQYVANENFCGIFATRHHRENVKLFCYYDGKCFLLQKEILPTRENPDPEIVDYKKCFTVFTEKDCATPDGKILKDQSKRSSNDKCFDYKCNEGILSVPPGLPPEVSKCPIGYKEYDGLGCVRYFSKSIPWCEARLECLKDNAELASIDVENMNPVQNFFTDQGLSRDVEMWIGLQFVNGSYKYLLEERFVEIGSDMWWRNGEPHCRKDCYSVARIYQGHLADWTPNNSRSYLCEISLSRK